jgi:electron transport complex protein RnfD
LDKIRETWYFGSPEKSKGNGMTPQDSNSIDSSSRFYISVAPHIRDRISIPQIMYTVNGALIPALIGALFFFGMRAAWLILASILAAIGTEWAIQKWRKVPITISDGSAILTGLLLAFNLPAGVPIWIPILGSIFAILIGKQVFGGLGFNPMNPALLGRAFLMASWPVHMTKDWLNPFWWTQGTFNFFSWGVRQIGSNKLIDSVTGATPLDIFKTARKVLIDTNADPDKVLHATENMTSVLGSYKALFFGNVGGCIGETSAVLLLLGAAFLLYRRIIGWKIPFFYLGTLALLAWVFAGTNGLFSGDPLFHILAGGVMLGAFFMATDMVTTPITYKGQIIFGVGCGVITIIIRLIGGYPEGCSYSILLMNMVTPLIDRYTIPKKFGLKPVKIQEITA